MKHLSLCILLLCTSFALVFGQKEKKSSGEYQLNLSRSDLSESRAYEYCKEMARVNAIEKVFGTVIIQGNTTSIRNSTTGEEVETSQIFNMMAETYVNGDWIKTLDEDCNRFTQDGEFWVKCKVKGIVRELSQPKLDLAAKALDCEELNCETERFKNGESLFLYFKSPVKGYLTVYLADNDVAQRIFPYRNMPEGQLDGVTVKSDKEYILFSKDNDRLDLRSYVDEYELYAAQEEDLNRIYVIFSEKPLRKPALSEGVSRDSGFEMPLELSAEDFQRWLAQNRQYDQGMQVERLDITISK